MKTKNIISFVTMISLIAFGAAAAETTKSFSSGLETSVGIKEIATEGSGAVWADDFDLPSNRTEPNFGGGIGLLGKASFGRGKVRYMNQIEINLLFNSGIGNDIQNIFDSDDKKGYLSVTVLDIPLLFGLDIDVGAFTLTPYIGPYVSVPLSGRATFAGKDYSLSCGGANFGGTAGFGAALKWGPGKIFLDARYCHDFTETRMKIDDLDKKQKIFQRSEIQCSLGYVLSF